MIVIRVQEQDNNANGYLVWWFQMVSRLKKISRSIHKWCLDQLISDILQMVLIKIANVQEMVFINKSNKWFHARKFFQVVSHSYMWYQSYKTVVPQVISTLSEHQVKNASLIQELKLIKWMTHAMT